MCFLLAESYPKLSYQQAATELLKAHPKLSRRLYYSFAQGHPVRQSFETPQGLFVNRFSIKAHLHIGFSNREGFTGFCKKFLPADSELDAIDTKSLQRFSQNFDAASKSFARSFSWWEIKIIFWEVNSSLVLRIYQSRSKIAFRFTNQPRHKKCELL